MESIFFRIGEFVSLDLFEVAVLNGIVLLDHINELRKEGGSLRKSY
ncbi:MAG: hypothetical protein Q7J86_11980 [Bacteroidota bacterium]|nr:hypothetical protein [Bacteroidota bacterium]MDO9615226.1 hypothetical protein [Bacteroidota bacterium]